MKTSQQLIYAITLGLLIVCGVFAMICIAVLHRLSSTAISCFGALGLFSALGCKTYLKHIISNSLWKGLLSLLVLSLCGLIGLVLLIGYIPTGIMYNSMSVPHFLIASSIVIICIVLVFLSLRHLKCLRMENEDDSDEVDENLLQREDETYEDWIKRLADNALEKAKQEKENARGLSNEGKELNMKKENQKQLADNSSFPSQQQMEANVDQNKGNVIETHCDNVTRKQDADYSSIQDKPTIKVNKEAESNSVDGYSKKISNNHFSLKQGDKDLSKGHQETTIKEDKSQESLTNKLFVKGHKKLIMSIIGFCLLLTLGTVIFYTHYSPKKEYNMALEFIRNGNTQKGESMLKKLADNGMAKAAVKLGGYYWNGDTLGQSKGKALKYYKIGADLGDTLGIYNYGLALSKIGQLKNGISFLKKAGELGVWDAYCNLACIYGSKYWYGFENSYFNLSVSKRYAEQLPDSLSDKYYWIGNYYEASEYVDDYEQQSRLEKAFYWYRKGAEKNNINCLLSLGLMYFYGQGVQENRIKAENYFKQTLKINNINDEANYYMGLIYLHEYNNIFEAKKYLKVAADNGNEDAQAELARLEM